jgi:hypothetical protein
MITSFQTNIDLGLYLGDTLGIMSVASRWSDGNRYMMPHYCLCRINCVFIIDGAQMKHRFPCFFLFVLELYSQHA